MCEPRSNGHGGQAADETLDRLKDRGATSIWNLFPSERGRTPSGRNESER